MPKKETSVAVEAKVEAQPSRLDLLEGFAELVSERYGYWTARRLKVAELNEKIGDERKKANEIRKAIAFRLKFDRKNGGYSYDMGEVLKMAVENGDWESFKAKLGELAEVKKNIDGVAKPYRQEINLLNRAVRYMDNVAIPDSLKELGYPVEPRFSLSEHVKKGIESQRKRKK
jgi:hypothetical protein